MKLSRPITDKSLHDPAVEKGKQLQGQPGSRTAVHPPTHSFAFLCLHDIRFFMKQAHPVVRTVRLIHVSYASVNLFDSCVSAQSRIAFH